ncbi:MAG: radical SAM protein [Lachnospiraceae bacterium]|nr:radical SAM protein [Ruminococcus sp.]MCM1274632.1 radical SAM protein [Lachnospiraceae bacterium]
MKRTNLSIFIPHIGCPHMCSFCDQRSITGERAAPTAERVAALLGEQAANLERRGMTAEIAFFGGSFTAIPRDYMLELLGTARAAVERFSCYTGIRCSTRPDCVDEETVDILKKYGVTAVELGAQSMSEEVLSANDRGHTAEDVRRAAGLIKRSGIELGLQMMTGLYKDAPERCIETAEEFIALAPKTVRIYPTVILKNTRLGELFERGEYRSFSFEETVELCAELLKRFSANGIRVIRLGLHASPDVEREMLGGVYHPALREIVESRIFLNDMRERLERLPKGYYHVYTDSRNISKAAGQRKCNVKALAELGYEIDILPLDGEYLLIK